MIHCTTHHICDCKAQQLADLEAKLKKARECLAWYANWVPMNDMDLHRYGQRARECLAEIEK